MINEKMNDFFPYATKTIKSTDAPWMTDHILGRIKARKRVYKRNERSLSWKSHKRETNLLVKNAKRDFYQKFVKLAKETNDPSLYYKAVGRLKVGKQKPPFSLLDLFPGKGPAEVAECAADFFTQVSDRFEPLEPADVPRTDVGGLDFVVTNADVEKRLKECRKPKGLLEGDVWPDMISKWANEISVPLAEVIGTAIKERRWPKVWKNETVSIIPKKPHPETLEETRNISCTPLFSKVFEYFLLKRLQGESKPGKNQYGGIAGSSTNHYLFKAWNAILESLDQEGSACALVSIDFAKAFNTMSHQECLLALKKRGASQMSIDLVASFLTDRKMRFKVADVLSEERPLKGGAPQGTLLGNFLFIITTDELEHRESNGGAAADHGGGIDDHDEEQGATSCSGDDEEEPPACSTPARPVPLHETMGQESSDSEGDSICHFGHFRQMRNRITDTPST